MQHTFFIAPTEIKTGLTSITLGLIRALDQLGVKVACCKPISRDEGNGHRSVELLALASPGTPATTPIPLEKAQAMMGEGKQGRLMEEVIAQHRQISKDADVVIIEGLEPDRSEPFIAKLNTEMASTLGADVILVTAPHGRTPKALKEHVDMVKSLYGGEKNRSLLGVMINKINAPDNPVIPMKVTGEAQPAPEIPLEEWQKQLESKHFKVLGLIPWSSELVAPRTQDVANYLRANIINESTLDCGEAEENGRKVLDRRIRRISLCARTMPNMLGSLTSGTLVVTPGDRNDILLAAAMATQNGVPLAGILLTSGLLPPENIMQLLGNSVQHLPILSVATDSFQTATQLSNMGEGVTAKDPQRVDSIMNHMAEHINGGFFKDRLEVSQNVRMSPAAFRYQLVQLAQQANKRIVLPEGEEPRTIQAAAICQSRGIAQCILLGKRSVIEQTAGSLGITLPEDLTIMDPDEVRNDYVEPMVELRKHKQLTSPMAEAQLEDSVVLGTMMLALDHVDGLVSGAVHTTANTIRPALQLIKTAPDSKLVSSVFFMLLPEQVMVFGDCAVNPDPNAEELADIALQSALSAQAFSLEPKVAMISYSTGSSGSGSDVEKVRQATESAKARKPELLLDGPLQYDAATTANVAASKAPDSKVAGQANVLIFPDLNTGNTTYKAVQRSANVVSIGPMLQGLAKPVNDLSRGALVEDIVYTIALTAIQADKPV